MTNIRSCKNVRLILLPLLLLLSCPHGVFGNWGMEVGRADATDVASLASDWLNFKRERERLDLRGIEGMLMTERQRQLIGAERDSLTPQQIFVELQDRWINNLMGPLQRIALNPAASCAEAQFALSAMIGMRRQQQLFGLEESALVNNVYRATEEMAALRCRDEALDECVATGRFTQILELMVSSDRQTQLLGGDGSLDSWAEDALRQCAIYELQFVSTTKLSDIGQFGSIDVETVRDGKIQIRFETPAGGLKALKGPLGAVLKGETKGGNNPFFVSVKCKSPVPIVQIVCSPGADSTPVQVRINALELRHREFYIDRVQDNKFTLREAEFSRERTVGEDKFTFEIEGGAYTLQGLIKADDVTLPVPIPGSAYNFYIAHKKDQIAPPSYMLKIENPKRGVYPAIFQFTYADQAKEDNGIFTDSTEFRLVHKPEPKPFRKLPEPTRKPLRRPTNN